MFNAVVPASAQRTTENAISWVAIRNVSNLVSVLEFLLLVGFKNFSKH